MKKKKERTLFFFFSHDDDDDDDDDYTFEYLDVFTLNMNTHALKYICIYIRVCSNERSLFLSHMAFPNCIFLLNIKLVLCIKPSMMPTTLYTPPTMAINVVMNW